MGALTPKTIDLTPLIPVLRALYVCITCTFVNATGTEVFGDGHF